MLSKSPWRSELLHERPSKKKKSKVLFKTFSTIVLKQFNSPTYKTEVQHWQYINAWPNLVDFGAFLLCVGAPQHKHGSVGVFVKPRNDSIGEHLPSFVLVRVGIVSSHCQNRIEQQDTCWRRFTQTRQSNSVQYNTRPSSNAVFTRPGYYQIFTGTFSYVRSVNYFGMLAENLAYL